MSTCTTWTALGRLRPPVLLIANSAPENAREIGRTFEALATVAAVADLRVIAPPAVAPAFEALGVARDRIQPATVHGAELELNFFLEHEHAQQWVAEQAPRTVVGTAPHNLYNEEVKDLFEARVLMFLGRAAFLAHALPSPYVYVLAARDLLQRTTRPAKLAAYEALVESLLDDFHAQWQALGRPSVSDTQDYADVAATFARHLGPEILRYDEHSPIASPIAAYPAPALVARLRRAKLQQAVRRLKAWL